MKRTSPPMLLLIAALALFTNDAAAQPTPPEDLGLSSRFVELSTGVRVHYVEKGRNDNNGTASTSNGPPSSSATSKRLRNSRQ